MIQELVSTYSLAQLNELMMASADPRVPLYWGMFTKVEPKLQGGVLIGLGVRCAAFNIPNARAISAPITPVMAANGIRLVDFAELRRPRTAVYVVVPEGDAARYRVVLATLFGLAASHLRKGELDAESAPVLFNFDEAGNIFIHGLNELLGVGRGRRMAVALDYQNIGQVYHHYGSDGGDAVLGSIGTMIFLPGLDHRTRNTPRSASARRRSGNPLWHTKPQPDYGSDGRRAWTKNYIYFYTKVNDETYAFWALPVGPRRQYAPSFFVVLSPGWMRAWKGGAMSDEEIAQVPAIPSPAVLADFKMQKTPYRIFQRGQVTRTSSNPKLTPHLTVSPESGLPA
jgi:hypothetical protein